MKYKTTWVVIITNLFTAIMIYGWCFYLKQPNKKDNTQAAKMYRELANKHTRIAASSPLEYTDTSQYSGWGTFTFHHNLSKKYHIIADSLDIEQIQKQLK